VDSLNFDKEEEEERKRRKTNVKKLIN